MKKRILALFLVMLTVFGAFSPMYSLPSMASEEETTEENGTVTVPIYDMTVGKTYSAYFKRDDDGSSPNVYIYNDGKATKAYETTVSAARFPEELKVVLESDTDRCVKVLNEDWPSIAEDFRYVDYNDIVVVEPVETEEGYILGKVSLSGDSVLNNRTTIRKGEKVDVLASAAEDIADGARYQWQVKIGEDKWATITGHTYYYLILTRALLLNFVDNDGVASVRCIVTSGGKSYVSRELRATLSDEAVIPSDSEVNTDTMRLATAPLYMSAGDDGAVSASHEDHTGFEVVISYKFRHENPATILGSLNGEKVANTFTISLHENGYYSGTIASPYEVGYLPYVKVEQKDFVTAGTSSDEIITYGGVQYVAANSIEFKNVGVETHVEVFYIPQFVNYTVKIYEQKLYDDNYTLVDTKIYNDKRANTEVGKGLNLPRVGFDPVPYDDTAPISEDGTTVVEIHYDRLYYSVDYDLNDRNTLNEQEEDGGANGAVPSLVRYNTPVMLPLPSLKGYNFSNWSLISVKDSNKELVNSHSYATTVSAGTPVNVRHHLLYKANWDLAKTIYTLVYWLEDADSTNSDDKKEYNVWYTHKITVTTGDYTIAGADNVKNYITTGNGFTADQQNDVTSTYPYLTYRADLSDTNMQQTKGEGTTTVDIYYARKEYDLKFYYAIEKTSNSNKKTYHIIGGSTYYFGSYASGTSRTDEEAAMRQYASGSYTSQTGQVTALPTLNEKGLARNYTLSYDEDGNNNYHYLTFKAKFGADISHLWPCDVFNSAERTSANTHGQWSGKQAFVSAWNGEYRVRYTQDSSVNNGNQTIKGNYTVLDANLLWNDTSITDDTIAYACFWENGANINWSVPELYRYNIYLPLLPNQSEEGLTIREYNGTRYYLADQYNTCDDSTTAAQTQPGLVGFRANGRTSATIPRSEYNTSLYKEAYDMFYFYSRNIYHLTFNDMHGNTVTLSVPYDTYIGNHSKEEHAPAYPSDFEEGEARFENWYYDESLTILFDHHARMPAKNIQLYAKWEILSYNVTVYYDTAKTELAYTQKYKFGDYAHEPSHEDFQEKNKEKYKDLIFNGWYYNDGEGEIRFDFNTMMIKSDMVLYAKWTSKVFVPYTIHYVIEDGNGGYIPIADHEEKTALAGVTKYFVPKVGDELNPGYRTGYFPEMRSHSMTMKLNETNEYYFVYSHANTIHYKVTHYFTSEVFEPYIGSSVLQIVFDHEISGEHVRASAATVDASFRGGISKSTIVNAVQAKYNELKKSKGEEPRDLFDYEKEEIWNAVKLLSPDYYVRPILLTTIQENSTEFHWEKRTGTATYQVVYYYEDFHGEFIPDTDNIESWEAAIGKTISVTAHPVSGFVPEKEVVTGVVSAIKVNDDGTFEPGLIIKVRYKRLTYNYTIYHYSNSSLTELKKVTGTALHGTKIKITDIAENIPGYVFAPPQEEDNVVVLASNNMEIKCYYNALSVYYRYQISGETRGATLSVINDDNAVVGARPESTTLSLINDGYFLNRWYYIVGDEEHALPDAWLSQDKMTVSPEAAPVEWAGKTVYIYAEVLPTTRRISVSGDVANNKEQAFIFKIQSVQKGQSEVDITFVIFGNDYVDIAMLPHGEYIITVTGWAWRYGVPTLTYNSETYQSANGVFALTLDESGDIVFNYTEAPNDKWITDDLAGYLHFTAPHTNEEEN